MQSQRKTPHLKADDCAKQCDSFIHMKRTLHHTTQYFLQMRCFVAHHRNVRNAVLHSLTLQPAKKKNEENEKEEEEKATGKKAAVQEYGSKAHSFCRTMKKSKTTTAKTTTTSWK